ncbi:glycosyltransferase 87 family protein [Streptomyces sp. DSM 44917]|uniref:Glycosyltransferase 87 family protein n=1 Tax=Streptomyces boetiae TaxID=3075541 RepID=A0ABU2LAA7_9ACTN|nr:glycosyltransferase 87 family protein [Streptomyces sp. DSM 44917]MDT0308511.1 glycosyltransferase 87 family protein [Streptomyces sp. DSM 44917]
MSRHPSHAPPRPSPAARPARTPLATLAASATSTPRRALAASALACLVSFAAFWIAQRAAGVTLIDLDVYRAEGWAVRTGRDLYDLRVGRYELPATYPPFAALLFIPLTWPGIEAARALVTAGNLLLVIALVHLSLRLIGRRPRRAPLLAASLAVAALAVWCEPVWTTLRYGQINLLLAVLVLWDLTRRPGHRWAGAGTGIAAGIKLTPALFAVFLALVGAAVAVRRLRRGLPAWNDHLRRAAVAAAAFAGSVLLAALAAPRASRRFWTEVVFERDRAGDGESTANQSLRGVLARALHTGDPGLWWAPPALLVAAAGLAVAAAALLAGRRLPHAHAWAAVTCGVTALLISPVSWSHHWVWAVPLVMLLSAEALARRDARPGANAPTRAVANAGARAVANARPVAVANAPADAGRWVAAAVGATVVFCSFALWFVPHDGSRPELHQNAGQMALSAIYPAAGLLFLALAATVTARAWLRHPPPPVTAARARVPRQARRSLTGAGTRS